MRPPQFEPIITLGNVITLISMLLALAGTFYTMRAEVDELRRAMTKFDNQISSNTNRLTALEEWKSIAPRFTQVDATALKMGAVAEAQIYTNGVAADMRNDMKELCKKIDNLTTAINDMRVMIAAQSGVAQNGRPKAD